MARQDGEAWPARTDHPRNLCWSHPAGAQCAPERVLFGRPPVKTTAAAGCGGAGRRLYRSADATRCARSAVRNRAAKRRTNVPRRRPQYAMKKTAPRNGRPKSPRRRAAATTAAASQTVHVGLTQMACSDDSARRTSRTRSRLIEQAAKAGRRSSARRSCSARSTSARSRTTASSSWPRRSPARAPTRSRSSRRSTRSSSSRRSSRSAPHGLYHNTAVVIDADGSILGIYRKMHIPDDPLYYEKFYFTPGDTGFRAWDTKYAQDRRADLLGPVVPRRRAPHRAPGRRDPLLPHRHRLAPEREGSSTARPSTRAGS